MIVGDEWSGFMATAGANIQATLATADLGECLLAFLASFGGFNSECANMLDSDHAKTLQYVHGKDSNVS